MVYIRRCRLNSIVLSFPDIDFLFGFLIDIVRSVSNFMFLPEEHIRDKNRTANL
jgi:hypothetical protein